MGDKFEEIIDQLKKGRKLDPPYVSDNTKSKRLKTKNEGFIHKSYKSKKNVGIRMYKSFSNDD